MQADSFFIAVYTNEVKSYCDEPFFANLHRLAKGNAVHIVDNSQNKQYTEKLRAMCTAYANFSFYHAEVDMNPKESRFHRSITTSVMLLRDQFLATNLSYFLIIESDVIPPQSLLDKWEKRIRYLDRVDVDWGILGGLYHQHFHLYFLEGLQQTYHALSGCTLYKRSLIEDYPFRWSPDNLTIFPDTWICWDAKNDYNIYNDHDIHCGHLENPDTGTRYTHPIR